FVAANLDVSITLAPKVAKLLLPRTMASLSSTPQKDTKLLRGLMKRRFAGARSHSYGLTGIFSVDDSG
ncbi:MAG TPA: hypothetical protein VGM27_26680, partial [Acidobacteriaceae bacterium]